MDQASQDRDPAPAPYACGAKRSRPFAILAMLFAGTLGETALASEQVGETDLRPLAGERLEGTRQDLRLESDFARCGILRLHVDGWRPDSDLAPCMCRICLDDAVRKCDLDVPAAIGNEGLPPREASGIENPWILMDRELIAPESSVGLVARLQHRYDRDEGFSLGEETGLSGLYELDAGIRAHWEPWAGVRASAGGGATLFTGTGELAFLTGLGGWTTAALFVESELGVRVGLEVQYTRTTSTLAGEALEGSVSHALLVVSWRF